MSLTYSSMNSFSADHHSTMPTPKQYGHSMSMSASIFHSGVFTDFSGYSSTSTYSVASSSFQFSQHSGAHSSFEPSLSMSLMFPPWYPQ